MTKDLTAGKPLKSIILFMLPIMVGNIFQQLYSMVDTIIVGQTISNQALAGVGVTNSMSLLIIGFVQGLTSGFSVKTSQCFGAKDEEGVKKSLAASLALSVAISIILTFVAVYTTMPLLRLMSTPEDVIGYAYDYIVAVYWGLAATVFYNLGSAMLRAVGDSRTPLIFLIFAAVLNVGLDFLFILQFDMGVAGAGWATVLSQAISAIGCFAVMFAKFPVYRIKLRHFISSVKFYWQHVALGLPMALQFSIIAIGIMVQQSALNQLGSVAVTAYTAANKIDSIVNQSLAALGSAVATFCGQNYGAMRYDRIRQGVKLSMLVGVVCSLVGFAFVALLAKPLTRLFSSEITQEILDLSQQYLLWQGGMYIFLTAIYVYRNALQGIGKSTFAMLGGAIEVAMRVMASLLLTKALGYTGICVSNPAAWIGADIFFVISYMVVIRNLRKKKGMLGVKEEPVDGDHIEVEGKKILNAENVKTSA